MELAAMNKTRCRLTDLEAHEEGEGQRDGDDPPRDHGEEPAADSDAAVRLVG